MKEADYRAWVSEFFNALIGRHPVLYPAIGVLMGLAMLLLAFLLFPAVQPRFRYVTVFQIGLGGPFLVFSALLLLIG